MLPRGGYAVGELLDGKQIGAALRVQVARAALQFRERSGRAAGLEVVLVGDDAASQVYVKNKAKACEEAGMRGVLHRLSSSTTTEELLALVRSLNERDDVDGILVQLPLPKAIDEQRVLDAVDPAKDVDGFHPVNAGLLLEGRPALVPCTPVGCMRLLEHTKVSLEGARAVVLGRSNIVGKPVAQLLLARNATVTMAHSRTRELPSLCREADVLIVAVGKSELVRGDWVRSGAIVIDVGINRTPEGKLVGDVCFTEAKERASWITPVPGGVGPMTIACLLENTVRAAWARCGYAKSELAL